MSLIRSHPVTNVSKVIELCHNMTRFKVISDNFLHQPPKIGDVLAKKNFKNSFKRQVVDFANISYWMTP